MNDRHVPDASLRQTLDVLRRRSWIVVLCVLLGAGAALGVSMLMPKLYTSTASLLFRDAQVGDRLLGRGLEDPIQQPSLDPDREAATNVLLVSLEVVADRTAEVLDAGITSDAVEDKIDVQPQGKSSIVDVEATDGEPRFALRLADTFSREYIEFRQEAARAALRRTESRIEEQLAALEGQLEPERREFLERRVDDIQILKSLETGEVELVQPATLPVTPSSPKPVQNTAAGLALGLVLGLALAFLRERLDRRFVAPDDVERAFGRPLLGAIPESRALAVDGRSKPRQLAGDELAAQPAFEAFGLLWANLRYFKVDRPVQSVLVTSAARGEGKSTVALHLATAAAATGARVLLIEADMRQPALGHRLGLGDRWGLAHVLSGHLEASGAVERIPVDGSSNGSERSRGFDVIVAGAPPPNPADLLDSDAARELLRGAFVASYDLVVIDSPPIPIVPDAIPLVGEVSGVIVVSRLNRTERQLASRLRTQLEHLEARTMGVVINSAGSERRYSYGYSYGYGRSP